MKKSKSTRLQTKRHPLALVAGFVVLLVGGYLIYNFIPKADQTILRVEGGSAFTVEIADDNEERYQGLSGRDSLGEREGMLFVYGASGQYQFVMRGMRFALDFVWIDSNKEIIAVTENVEPSTYPGQSFSSSDPARYILEVNSGTVAREGWSIGDKVEFNVE
ncbi:MAG: DUF192 domain-containing protein [Candidatus Saccharimonadales bacterium]|nr:DUF192 domain-containing protein [Candidatus Saccharimonadales bacterium]